jgi:transcriptional regulator with XRE-family HTH domain
MPRKAIKGHTRRWIKGRSKNPVLLPDDLRTLGNNVKSRRIALNMEQAALAEAAGVALRSIVNIETCAMNGWPSTPVFLKISRTLGLPDPTLFRPSPYQGKQPATTPTP